jgi:hypothetical protein
LAELATALVDEFLTLVDDSCVAVLPHVLRIAAELRVADVLANGPRDVDTIASEVDADTESLYRMLRALASVGLVAEPVHRTFALTQRGQRLRTDATDTSWASVVNIESQQAWIRATDTIRSSKSAFDQTHGGEFFEHKDEDPDANRMFLRRMRERAGRSYPRFPIAVDWDPSTVVMDIGGGDGYLLGRVLDFKQNLSGVLFDRQATVDVVRSEGALDRFGGRVSTESGDFFQKVPLGADTHLMCSVLHDWTDEQAVTILRNSKESLEPGGRLHIVEMVVPDGDDWHPSKWSDVGMMVLTGGRERTRDEFDALLSAAGYTLASVRGIPHSYFSVITAV